MRLPKLDIRPAARRDAGAIAAIYVPIVRDTFISFETEPPSALTMAERIEATQRRHPWLVATAAAAIHALEESMALSLDELVVETARLLGFARVGRDIDAAVRQAVDTELDEMVEKDHLGRLRLRQDI